MQKDKKIFKTVLKIGDDEFKALSEEQKKTDEEYKKLFSPKEKEQEND